MTGVYRRLQRHTERAFYPELEEAKKKKCLLKAEGPSDLAKQHRYSQKLRERE